MGQGAQSPSGWVLHLPLRSVWWVPKIPKEHTEKKQCVEQELLLDTWCSRYLRGSHRLGTGGWVLLGHREGAERML